MPPKSVKVRPGRVNTKNDRYLYLATDKKTAMLEVSANPNEYISIADIKLKKHILLAYFSKNCSGADVDNEEYSKWINSYILGLDNLFEKPCEEGDYRLCQYISKHLKKWGFDGVFYNSSKNPLGFKYYEGKNIALFDDQKCEIKSSKLYYVISTDISSNPSLEE